jgi:hypothetical protein
MSLNPRPHRGCLVSAAESHQRDLRRAQYRAGLQSRAPVLQMPNHMVHFPGCGCAPIDPRPSVKFAPLVRQAVYPLTRGEVKAKQIMSEHVDRLAESGFYATSKPLGW